MFAESVSPESPFELFWVTPVTCVSIIALIREFPVPLALEFITFPVLPTLEPDIVMPSTRELSL